MLNCGEGFLRESLRQVLEFRLPGVQERHISMSEPAISSLYVGVQELDLVRFTCEWTPRVEACGGVTCIRSAIDGTRYGKPC